MAKQINNNKICALIVGCFLSLYSMGQTITIDNTDSLKNLNKKFWFSVSNNTDSNIVYYISMEMLENNHWSEIVSDVFIYEPIKLNKLFTVVKKKTNKDYFYPYRHFKNPGSSKRFRLKIMYGANLDDIKNKQYSESFRFAR